MSAQVSGPARAGFERLMARFAVGLRVGGAVAAGTGGLLGLAPPAAPAMVVVAVAGLLGWAALYAVVTLRRGWRRWLVAGDIMVAAVLCLGYGQLVPAAVLPGWSTWLAVVASSAVVASQLSPWPVLGMVGTVVVPSGCLTGLLLAGHPVPGLAPLLAVQGVATGLLMTILRRRAVDADRAIAAQEALQRDAAVQAGRRAEDREHCRLLHDNVTATLTVVAAGGVAGSPMLRAQASRDLAVVELLQAPVTAEPDPTAEAGGGVDGGAGETDRPGHGGFGDLVVTRYQRGFELGLVAVLAVRHLASAAAIAVSHRWAYRSLGAEVVAWVALTGIGVAGSIRLLQHRSGPRASRLLAGAALAASLLATAGMASGQELTAAHWALGATGWFGVVLLLRRPIAELATFIAVNAGFTLILLVHGGAADRGSLARLLVAVYAMTAMQLGITLVVKALDGTARQATAAAEQQAAVRHRGEVAEALHRNRLDRYQTVCRSVVPLLVGLADGDLDPADRRTQRRCAIEASQLRWLSTETDDVPDPLLHELRACADIANHRGVSVDLQVVGQLPALDRPVRRALTEVPLHALAGAAQQARVTVYGRPDEVAISVLTDVRSGELTESPAPGDRTAAGPAVKVTTHRGPGWLWTETRWRT